MPPAWSSCGSSEMLSQAEQPFSSRKTIPSFAAITSASNLRILGPCARRVRSAALRRASDPESAPDRSCVCLCRGICWRSRLHLITSWLAWAVRFSVPLSHFRSARLCARICIAPRAIAGGTCPLLVRASSLVAYSSALYSCFGSVSVWTMFEALNGTGRRQRQGTRHRFSGRY
jgi:hypothetical protein